MNVVERAKSPGAVNGWSARKLQSEMRKVESAIGKQRLAVEVIKRHLEPAPKYTPYEFSGKKLVEKKVLDAIIPMYESEAKARKRSLFDGELSQAGPMSPELFESKAKLEAARQKRDGLVAFKKNVLKKQKTGEARWNRRAQDVLEEYLQNHETGNAKAAFSTEQKNLTHLTGYLERLRQAKAAR